MAECKICGKTMRWIQNTHLKLHNITKEEYMGKFPDAVLKDEEITKIFKETRMTVERPICAREGCNNRTTNRNNKYCSYSCSSTDRIKLGTNAVVKMGEDNVGYINGRYASWSAARKEAFDRDKGCCIRCKTKIDPNKDKYGAHHIIPRRIFEDYKEADDLNNIVTLCNKCHQQVEADSLLVVYKLFLSGEFKDIDTLREYLKDNLIYVN